VPLVLPEGDCSFCAYLSGERPYTILATGAVTALLVTYEQRGIGHVLTIPRAHRPTLLDLDRDEASAVMATTVIAARAISDAFDPSGIAVWQNNGVAAHQSVPHVHVHVAGTLPEGGRPRGRVPRLTLAQTDAIAAVLRPHVAAIP
jgi:histidine triad (HIT) family protein